MNAETIASLTTAAGTLVLAVATYSSTQAATRASRIAEQALLAGLRPVLMQEPTTQCWTFTVTVVGAEVPAGVRAS